VGRSPVLDVAADHEAELLQFEEEVVGGPGRDPHPGGDERI